MDINTKTLGNVTSAAFGKAVGYFKRSAKTINQHFENGVIYAVGAVFATGDYTHINKLLPALALAGLEPKFRRTVVRHNIVPFKYDAEACLFTGKIQKGKRAALEMLNTDEVPQWEVVLRAALDGELPENKAEATFKLETRLPNLIRKAVENGYTVQQIRALVNDTLKDVAPKPAQVQEVKQGLREEAEESRKAA